MHVVVADAASVGDDAVVGMHTLAAAIVSVDDAHTIAASPPLLGNAVLLLLCDGCDVFVATSNRALDR